ncbi:reverse transcriptase-like protein [Elysia marginata]|uniref:Reverse transcriptase-like protein n=1 Tax=Elysia marginata TaxID=1093978 RepID=A0AAV4FPP5_9GAST|nr:reverse transcriptase-like protein [Elysia marginata]
MHLHRIISKHLDPLQFAYKANRSKEDVILHIINNSYAHLDKRKACVRLMLYDFSSAFNMIQAHLLYDKMIKMSLPPALVLWVTDCLTSRQQYVRLGPTVYSVTIITNTSAAQGTVLSPFFFCIYTSDYETTTNKCIDKYAGDTVLTGRPDH